MIKNILSENGPVFVVVYEVRKFHIFFLELRLT